MFGSASDDNKHGPRHRLQRQPNHSTRQVPRFGSTSSTPGMGFSFAKVAKPTKDSKPDEKATADDDEDESSKVEFTPIKEKDSIFSKRCKLFVKTDGNYSDSGIGTLHIKNVDVKMQVLVRADTSIGQILLNIILNEVVPVQGDEATTDVGAAAGRRCRHRGGGTTATLETITTLQFIRRPHAREHHPRAGLRSKDAENRRSGFSMNEPEQYISALLREISTLMQQKTVHVVTAVCWLKALIHSHTSQLMMLVLENLLANFGTCLGIIEYRVQHANSLSK
ncbi:nucleoporin [Culex quinquefasciatus]|uniref:Nucleoporin n=1 Tax=Culex quinquefasciatus TaxID=7176 RepID=B0W0J8_CULQU|nr:nucleoporin [Culex quinquefasciatus]|eukprot:XP_001842232.1 nucleoporin [Culex quinquefasciatus]